MSDDPVREPRIPSWPVLRGINSASPIVQSALSLGIQLPLMGILWAFGLDQGVWLAAAGMLLLFVLLNPFLGLRTPRYPVYLLQSAALFMVLFFMSVMLADRISRISLEEYGAEAMVFLAPVLYYPFSIFAALMVRFIMRRRGRGPGGGSRP